MKLRKCERCGEPTAEGLPLCPDCMKESGAAAEAVAAAEELLDIARVMASCSEKSGNCAFLMVTLSGPAPPTPG